MGIPPPPRRPSRRAVPLLLVLLAPLSGCQPPRGEGTLIIASRSRIDSLDPAKASRVGQLQVLSALGDPLYAILSDGRLEPRLATALPRLSADGLRARIPLRRGVLFHDGTRFDAEAMAFSLRRFLAIGTLGYQLSDRVAAVRVSGPHEIELVLKRPFSPLPRLLSSIFLTPSPPPPTPGTATNPSTIASSAPARTGWRSSAGPSSASPPGPATGARARATAASSWSP